MTRVPLSCFQGWVEVAWCQEEVETEEEAPQSYQGSVPSGLLYEPEKREGVEERRGKGGEGGGREGRREKGAEKREEREGGKGGKTGEGGTGRKGRERGRREGKGEKGGEEEKKGTRVKYKY